jgi:hypothetical protein
MISLYLVKNETSCCKQDGVKNDLRHACLDFLFVSDLIA